MLRTFPLNSEIHAKALVSLVPLHVLKPHEDTIESRVVELLNDISRSRRVLKPVIVDFKTLVILDGHHRVEALRRLGLRYAPAILVDYDSDCVSVSSWRKGIRITKEIVREAGLKGFRFPPRTTRHSLCFEVPEVNIDIELLR